MKKIGTINGCNIAYLLNGQGVRIGETLDTPNAIACAMANYEDIYNSVSYYQLFGETRRFRFELEDRFKSCVNNPTLLSYLKMY
jgi:hypothetical protein